MRNIIISALLLSACTDEDATTATLRKAGFSRIATGSYAWSACGEGDTFATKFTADNPSGVRVSGVVCCGWLKSCTIRF